MLSYSSPGFLFPGRRSEILKLVHRFHSKASFAALDSGGVCLTRPVLDGYEWRRIPKWRTL
ncbi:hypothetical protein LINPERHAP1_LOCUS9812 [Linum perenne]